MILAKTKKTVARSFSFNSMAGLNDRIYLKAVGTSCTATVTFRDSTIQVYTVTTTGTTILKSYASSLPAGAVKVEIDDSTKIQVIQFWYSIGEFPSVIGYTNLNNIGFVQTSFGLNNPYIDAVKSQLKTMTFRYPNPSDYYPNNMLFWDNINNIEYFLLENQQFLVTDHLLFLSGKTKLKTLALIYSLGTASTTMTDLPNNIENLIYLTTLDCARFSTALSTSIFSRLQSLCVGLLKVINFYNCFTTTARVDAFIIDVYDRCMANDIRGVSFDIRSISASAIPTGTYNGTTDWVGGAPTTPRAKLWHLVNSKSHVWNYDV